ncbi:hypothetical protein SHJJP8921_001158 [Staphylococcus lugdunensis]|uniref:hypothetical protein n=1 Tax=Staphylococcus lugdunensis TaxID=28035 RepID=UPI001F4CB355|nr:hypothetical protein [Staphylococcus lugdunensis]MCH8646899.1 hypothetical protein [Staphylococcus lugdunensis]
MDILDIINPKMKNGYKLRELENIGYNIIPNKKGVYYIYKHNSKLLYDKSTNNKIDIKGNILYVGFSNDIRKSIKKFIEDIKIGTNEKISKIEFTEMTNLKVSWIDSKKYEQIYSYIIKQHKNKYGDWPFFNDRKLKLKSYSESIEKLYAYISKYD